MVYALTKLKMPISFRHFDGKLFKEIAGFSSFIFINLVVDQINWNIDKVLLGMLQGAVAVAVYGIASQINAYFLQISTTISSVFTPRVNEIVASEEKPQRALNTLMISVGRWQFVVMALVGSGIVFFGKEFIRLWAGKAYGEAYDTLLFLCLPLIVPLIQNTGIEIQRAMNMHQFRSYVYLGMAIVNIFVSIPLIKRFGVVGSAAGTAISLIVANGFIMNWFYQKRMGLDMVAFWKSILRFVPSLIIPFASGVVINHLLHPSSWKTLLLGIMIYMVIYVLCMWAWGLNTEEKRMVKAKL